MTVSRRLVYLWVLFFLQSCGESQLSKRFRFGVARDLALANNQIELFRDPVVNGGDPGINFTDNLDVVPRTTYVLRDMKSQTDPLAANYLNLYSSSTLTQSDAPNFYFWAGTKVPWRSPEFKAFMVYHHLTSSHAYATSLFPNVNFNSSGVLPIKAVYREEGFAYKTSYNPNDKTIRFYEEKRGSLAGLNLADSGDVIAHEYAHLFQHVMNKEWVESTSRNHHYGAILEGLADYFTAALFRDDKILLYLSNNFQFVDNIREHIGPIPSRTLTNNLFFPEAFTANRALDGRVLATALNDFRKYLSGEKITLVNCSGSNCHRQLSQGAMTSSQAYDNVLMLSYAALRSMGPSVNQTFHAYSQKLEETCLFNNWCAPRRDVMMDILRHRGLWYSNLVTSLPSIDSASGDLLLSADLGWAPVRDSGGMFSNSDSKLQACEVVYIFPNVINQSSGTAQGHYWIEAQIKSIENLEHVAMNHGRSVYQVEQVFRVEGGREVTDRKVIGMLKAPEPGRPLSQTSTLMINPNSFWYQNKHGGFFAKFVTFQMISNFASELVSKGLIQDHFFSNRNSWLLRVKPNVTRVKARFDVWAYPFNATREALNRDDATAWGQFKASVEQAFDVEPGNNALCDNQGN